MPSTFEESRESVLISCFWLLWGQAGEDDRACHTADWLAVFFHMSHPSSSWQGVSFSFSSSFGILVYEEKHFKWQTQTPGALQRSKASQDCCCCSCHHPFHWHDGMKGCMSPLPVPPPTSFPARPRSVQPLPSFISVKLCELFLNHLSCLYAGFLRRNSTMQRANPCRVWEARGGRTWRKVL